MHTLKQKDINFALLQVRILRICFTELKKASHQYSKNTFQTLMETDRTDELIEESPSDSDIAPYGSDEGEVSDIEKKTDSPYIKRMATKLKRMQRNQTLEKTTLSPTTMVGLNDKYSIKKISSGIGKEEKKSARKEVSPEQARDRIHILPPLKNKMKSKLQQAQFKQTIGTKSVEKLIYESPLKKHRKNVRREFELLRHKEGGSSLSPLGLTYNRSTNFIKNQIPHYITCLLYTSPSPRDRG
eukprot:TRINITY_DN16047_c0_g1_i2.p1 TRINITY_DN16047_c0_g1~~TRINITY_DN16047_c0_g1_i2.p1  ORF type:complete len:242 (-),score=40.60 TRINITY_DN16047_c0_g1_i2:35-760(-)